MTFFKNSLLVAALISATISFSQDSLSVLFIGNSYTYVNDLPTVFLSLTQSLGDNAAIDSKTNGGFTFQNHLIDPLTHTKIKSQDWDYVILQGQSQEPSFPFDQVNTNTLPPAVQLADSVYANNFCSQVMYFMTWGRQIGDPQWDSINTFDKMNFRLRNAYVRISDSAQASVSPVGVAWKYVRDNFPAINLYSADGSHPSMEGTYLAACTFYASLFRKSPLGATYTAGLNSTVAQQLQAAANLSVLDSLSTWHLRSKSDITIANFTSTGTTNDITFQNQSWRATSYSWSFGDGNNSSLENSLHSYANPGNYLVELIAESVCGNDTIYQTIHVNNVGIAFIDNSSYKIQYLGDQKYRISNLNPACSFELIDASGRSYTTNYLVEKNEKTLLIDLSTLAYGIYFLKIENAEYSSSLRLIRN
jgi:PKD repeat protein